MGNENAVPVKVFLPQTSAPTDVVSVTLTDDDGRLGLRDHRRWPVARLGQHRREPIDDGMLNATRR